MRGSTDGEEPTPERRRRSARLTSPLTAITNGNKMAHSAVKRSIVVKKIAPRKTKTAVPVPPLEEHDDDKENATQNNLSTPGRVGQAPRPKKKAVMPSPILASPPPPPLLASPPRQPAADPEDLLWSNKVRRSYSRLSDPSFNEPSTTSTAPHPRRTMFGFGQLQTPEVFRRARPRSGPDGSLCGLSGSFASLSDFGEGPGGGSPEPDLHIPGVVTDAERKRRRRRRKKAPKIDAEEVDCLAAKMNAEFTEAEGFELFVE
ncbi:hypothetical protein NHX12_023665 [Muraenolepis orangiensis]|uniref:Sororin C-terminal region domain-containing protein n=1 Tax=Muraenolepis orangiensis TaxID=630683 RepID=A0A9Q0ELI6_9TELE|nr:hypothetical protein NHX12_023665 [Muraenolepis orangiensis]